MISKNEGQLRYEEIRKDEFLKDLLEKSLRYNILTEEEINYINFGISKILEKMLIYFTKNESSSINIDIADNLLKSVCYTISISLTKNNNINKIINDLKNRSIESLFHEGQRIIKKKFINSKKLLEHIKQDKLKISNYSYLDTIDYGIDVFIKKYNYFYKAHEVPGDIDYQLSDNVFSYEGVEQIEKYLINLNYENIFCNYFNISEVRNLLYSYSNRSDELLINVFDIVLANSVGNYILGKNPFELDIKDYEKIIIEEKIKNKEILNNYIEFIVEEKRITDDLFVNYIKKGILKFKELLFSAANNNGFKNVFVTFIKEDKNILEYKPQPKLSNKQFKKIYETIISLNDVNEKIRIIKNEIKNIEDLIDILNSDCFYENEFVSLYESLDEFSLSLIISYNLDINDDYCDKAYEEELKKYINSLPKNMQDRINEISKQINLL